MMVKDLPREDAIPSIHKYYLKDAVQSAKANPSFVWNKLGHYKSKFRNHWMLHYKLKSGENNVHDTPLLHVLQHVGGNSTRITQSRLSNAATNTHTKSPKTRSHMQKPQTHSSMMTNCLMKCQPSSILLNTILISKKVALILLQKHVLEWVKAALSRL